MPYRKRERGPNLGAVIEALETDIAQKKAWLKTARLLAKIPYVAARAPSIPVPRPRRIKRRRRRKVKVKVSVAEAVPKTKAEVAAAEVVPRRKCGRLPKAKPAEVPATTAVP